MNRRLRANLMLLLTAFIWGSTFVAQSAGMDLVGPFTYVMTRNILGVIVLQPVIFLLNRSKPDLRTRMLPDALTLRGGVCCGVVLAIASCLQQSGMVTTSPGKAGFITALYIILVPLFGMVIGKKTPWVIWLCALGAVAGFWLLCIKEDFSVAPGDLLVLGCAAVFAVHILVINHFANLGADGVKMSCVQFAVAAILTAPFALFIERPAISNILAAWLPIAYAGVLSSGVAYTLQIVSMRDAEPTTATLIMSLESVFAALSGLVMGKNLAPREWIGCAIVFAAVILAQLPIGQKRQG